MPEIEISEAAARMGRVGGAVAAEKLRKKLKLSAEALSMHMRWVANKRYAKTPPHRPSELQAFDRNRSCGLK